MADNLPPLPATRKLAEPAWGYTTEDIVAHALAAVLAERERCAAEVERLRDEHCAATQTAAAPSDRCHPDDDSCEFVAAWNDAAAAIRARGE